MVELNFSAGDEIRLRLSDKELDGTALESSDNSIVLLKLESGYNIGIPKENILGYRVLKKFKVEETIHSANVSENMCCKQVLVIFLQDVFSMASSRNHSIRFLTLKILCREHLHVPFAQGHRFLLSQIAE